jgi:hypothetical protein
LRLDLERRHRPTDDADGLVAAIRILRDDGPECGERVRQEALVGRSFEFERRYGVRLNPPRERSFFALEFDRQLDVVLDRRELRGAIPSSSTARRLSWNACNSVVSPVAARS